MKDDATHFMKTAIAEGNSWDIVILDPPKLAPSRKVNRHSCVDVHDALYLINYGGVCILYRMG